MPGIFSQMNSCSKLNSMLYNFCVRAHVFCKICTNKLQNKKNLRVFPVCTLPM